MRGASLRFSHLRERSVPYQPSGASSDRTVSAVDSVHIAPGICHMLLRSRRRGQRRRAETGGGLDRGPRAAGHAEPHSSMAGGVKKRDAWQPPVASQRASSNRCASKRLRAEPLERLTAMGSRAIDAGRRGQGPNFDLAVVAANLLA
jgi:hypothetical protein